ncbi:type II 3-dehydroquinate dehydratase [Algicella marina]|uniref:3-dehydroquinate dehydratase n=1 Tax=Algicella marina TaxID=2683284 RepID=A0A6P1SXA6_9RHOB|nr:type II 3-dehydroquinate dehydratase [Algicella marina]QHQ33973.1 type II 3-dehydroquinate dehydratase [Algicella marina]
MKVLLLNGPNLNMLGLREPHIYGATKLPEVEAQCMREARELSIDLECRQTNSEGELVTWVQQARETHAAMIINAGAYTHTSVALHDALKTFEGLVIELHISNPHRREAFRHTSFVAPAADALIAGFGVAGYGAALRAVKALAG